MLKQAGELAVVAVCGLVVVLGGASARRSGSPTSPAGPVATADPQSLPGPLPSGAPLNAFVDLPNDGERATGCHFVDHGFGDFGDWHRLTVSGTKLVVRALLPPAARAVAADGSFRLLLHFHGAEPVRRQLAPEHFDLVVIAIDAGVGSKAYDQAFTDPKVFDRILEATEREVARAAGISDAHARRVIVSSWSAGYGAIARILSARPAAASGVVLLDSLYAGYTDDKGSIDAARVAPFLDAARGAVAGGPPFFLSHTAIATPGYASTREVASYLLAQLNVPAHAVEDSALARIAEQGHLWLRGYAGADRDAHCQELHRLPEVLREHVLPLLP